MSTRENIRLIARAPFTLRKFHIVKNRYQLSQFLTDREELVPIHHNVSYQYLTPCEIYARSQIHAFSSH